MSLEGIKTLKLFFKKSEGKLRRAEEMAENAEGDNSGPDMTNWAVLVNKKGRRGEG